MPGTGSNGFRNVLRTNACLFVTSLTFLGVFLVLTMADTAERGKVDPLEAGEIQLVPGRPELMEALGGGGAHGVAAGDTTGGHAAGDTTGGHATADTVAGPGGAAAGHGTTVTTGGHGAADTAGAH